MRPSDSTPGGRPKEMKMRVHTGACTHAFTAALFAVVNRWKRPCLSSDKWIKTWPIHTIEYYLATERNKHFCDMQWPALENILLRKKSDQKVTM